MITINLLPTELRKARKGLDLKLPEMEIFITGGIILVVVMVIVYLISFSSAKFMGWTHNKLVAEYSKLEPIMREAEKLENAKKSIDKKIALLGGLIHSRIIWAKRLNQLSDILPTQTWLIKMAVEKRTEMVSVTPDGHGKAGISKKASPGAGKKVKKSYNVFILEGMALSRENEDMTRRIGDLIKKVREDSIFSSDFSSVSLVSTCRVSVADVDIMSFKIGCRFRQ